MPSIAVIGTRVMRLVAAFIELVVAFDEVDVLTVGDDLRQADPTGLGRRQRVVDDGPFIGFQVVAQNLRVAFSGSSRHSRCTAT
jgi:hypothetical protein